MTDKYIILLKRQLEELNKIGNNHATSKEYTFGVEAWKSSSISILERIFGKESRKLEEVEKIKLVRSTDYGGNHVYNIESIKETCSAIINACITELEIVGAPNQIYDGNNKGFNLTVNQENNQIVTIEVIIKEIQRELTGNQTEELQEILDTESSPEEKKGKLSNKLKQFGENTLSSIIAGILTNPTLYGIG